jgi:hypothetical protein
MLEGLKLLIRIECMIIITIIITSLMKKDAGAQKHTSMKWYKVVCGEDIT